LAIAGGEEVDGEQGDGEGVDDAQGGDVENLYGFRKLGDDGACDGWASRDDVTRHCACSVLDKTADLPGST
jgi:hypothetical protein